MAVAIALTPTGSPIAGAEHQGAPAAQTIDAAAAQLDERDRLWQQAQSLSDAGDLPGAIAAAERMLALEIELYSESDSEVAFTLAWLADRHFESGDFQAAADLRTRRLTILKSLDGVAAWEIVDAELALADAKWRRDASAESRQQMASATALFERAVQLYEQSQYKEALPLATEALAIRRDALPPDHPDTLDGQNTVASLLVLADQQQEGLALFAELLPIAERVYRGDHPRVAFYRHQVAGAYDAASDPESALLHRIAALQIRRATLGEENEDTADAYVRLATNYETLGDLASAFPLYQRALATHRLLRGEHDPTTAGLLNSLGAICEEAGQYKNARAYFRQALVICEESLGEDHVSTAQVLKNLADLYGELGDYPRALAAAERSLAIRRQALGDDDIVVAASLNSLAILQRALGDYEQARELSEQSLAIVKKHYGADHPVTAVAQNNLAAVLQELREDDLAFLMVFNSLETLKRAYGSDHPETIKCLVNFADLAVEKGLYAQAQGMLEQLHESQVLALGDEHPDAISSLLDLASLHTRLRDYARSRPLCERAVELCRKSFGNDHRTTAAALGSLAHVHEATGEYAAALALRQEALAIHQRLFGAAHPATASSLEGLAHVYMSIGQWQRARPLLEESLAVKQKVFGKGHVRTTLVMDYLAGACRALGDDDRALALSAEAVAIIKKTRGEGHPEYAAALHNLAKVHRGMDNYEIAVPLFREALAACETAFGKENPSTAQCQLSYASALAMSGDHAGALPLVEQALATMRETLGDSQPDVISAMVELATLHAALGEPARAVDGLLAAAMRENELFQRQVFSFGDHDLRALLEGASLPIHFLASLPLAQLGRQDEAFEVLLSRKAVVFEVLNLRRAAAQLQDADENVRQLERQLALAQRQSEQLALHPPAELTEENLAAQRDALRDTQRHLDEQLSRLLAKAIGSDVSLQVSLPDLRAALPDQSAHVEFFRHIPVRYGGDNSDQFTEPPRYAAFVLSSDPAAAVALVDLGPAADIESLIDQLAAQIEQFKRAASFGDEGEWENEYRQVAAALSAKLMTPLAGALGDTRQVTIGPDGRLHEVAFEALVDDSQQYLIEAGYRFAYVNSGRDLLRGRGELGSGVAVFARPDYALGYQQRLTAAAALLGDDGPLLAGAGAGLSRSADTRLGWRDLGEAALAEGQEAAAAFADAGLGAVASYVGGQALEEAVKRLDSPRILVLITHGDFLENEPEATPALDGTRSFLDEAVDRTASRGGAGQARTSLRAAEDPLLRSYLVLAGANQIDEAVPADVQIENGWLTAREIGQLDLNGTDLVVLSACSSNRGDANNGQAVAGMRSAFLFAGARTIVGSLFEVPNDETRELLRPFYQGVAAGQGKLAALTDAKLRFIEQRRANEGAAHPFYWASFVLVGEP